MVTGLPSAVLPSEVTVSPVPPALGRSSGFPTAYPLQYAEVLIG